MRLTPLTHYDPVVSVCSTLLGLLFGAFVVGWAKPVPFNPLYFTRKIRMKTSGALVSLAGPASNVILSFLFLGVMCISIRLSVPEVAERWKLLQAAFHGPETLVRLGLPLGQVLLLGLGGSLVFMNVLLAAFNILPLGPLDGAGVLRGVLPDPWLPKYDRIRYHPYTMPILFLLMLTGAVGFLLGPVRTFLYWALNPLARLILGV